MLTSSSETNGNEYNEVLAQNDMASEIMTDLYRYESLLDIAKEKGDTQFYQKNRAEFEKYKRMFARFMQEEE